MKIEALIATGIQHLQTQLAATADERSREYFRLMIDLLPPFMRWLDSLKSGTLDPAQAVEVSARVFASLEINVILQAEFDDPKSIRDFAAREFAMHIEGVPFEIVTAAKPH